MPDKALSGGSVSDVNGRWWPTLQRLRTQEKQARAAVERIELDARLARGRLEAIEASIVQCLGVAGLHDGWRCPDCRCLNADTESSCYRCGAGQPEDDGDG